MTNQQPTARTAVTINLGATIRVTLSDRVERNLVLKYRAATNSTVAHAEKSVAAMRQEDGSYVMPFVTFVALVGNSLYAFGMKDVAANAVPNRTLAVLEDDRLLRVPEVDVHKGSLDLDAFNLCALEGDVAPIDA